MVIADLGAGFDEAGGGGFQGLIVGGYLELEIVELGVIEDRPPVALKDGVSGLRGLPVPFLVGDVGLHLLVVGARGTVGLVYLGPTMQPESNVAKVRLLSTSSGGGAKTVSLRSMPHSCVEAA